MNDDASLLRSYADQGSEAAFAELVRRHLDLVYGAALRRTGGDSHGAADVAQQVFTNLARNARRLSGHTVISAWLHTATRNAALNLMISDQRRKVREAAALALHATDESGLRWEQLRPLLDEAIDELPDMDRSVVVLRFLEQRAFADVGATLRLSEDTARKRVDRALDKLRTTLERRGVKSTSAALAAAFANQVGATAPAGLAGAITSSALAGGAAGGLAVTGAGLFMSNTSTVIVSVVAFAAIGSTFFHWNRAQRAEVELAALTLERDTMRSQLLAEQQSSKRFVQDIGALRNEVETLKAKAVAQPASQRPAPSAAPQGSDRVVAVSQAKAMLNNLRQLAAARDQFLLENGRAPASLDELVGETKYVRRLNAVDGESYVGIGLGRGQPMTVTTVNGVNVTYDPVGGTTTNIPAVSPEEVMTQVMAQLGPQVGASFQRALQAYRAANGDGLPKNPQALLSYFPNPQEGADFIEALEAQKAASGK